MTTFLAPASMCFWAPLRSVKKPVDSITSSTSRSRHGNPAGSFSERTCNSVLPALIRPSPTSTSSPSVPRTESYLSRCPIVFASPRSLIATISKFPPRSRCARKKFRPIRPNPLIPTRVLAMETSLNEECRHRTAMSNFAAVFFCRGRRPFVILRNGGSALVRRRIQTPSDATVLSVVQPEGEVVLGASPPARRNLRSKVQRAGRADTGSRQSREPFYGRQRKRCLGGPAALCTDADRLRGG